MLNLISTLIVLSFSSCSIEGEQVCGIWNAQGDYGEMKLEITPWKEKFHGYLLKYKTANEKIKGAKEEEFIFLTDLVYEDEKYQNGKIYFDTNSEEYCTISLEMIGDNQLKAIYNCDGQSSEEIWNREGASTKSIVISETADDKKNNALTASDKNPTKERSVEKTLLPSTKEKAAKPQLNSKSKEEVQKVIVTKKDDYKTTKQSTFYIIGVHQTVGYDDMKGMEKAIETLWTQTYENDFSGKLKNIIDQERMYVAYSDYDKPKGKMTITIGYKVKDLSSVPSGLKGIKIPTNDFLVYPISGDKSDYEGDGWNQLAELMAYRKANSADFEIYTFDSNYKVKKAEMWIAAK